MMPWLLFLIAVTSLAFAINVVRPLHRPTTVAALSFFAGWLTGELALHHIALQLGFALVLVAGGALSAWPGVAALALLAITWTLLVSSYIRGRDTARVIDRALAGGLGEDWLDAIPPDARARLATAPSWRNILLPFPIRDRNIEVSRNILFHQYGLPLPADEPRASRARKARARLRLDVFRRKDRPDGYRGPTFVYVHGGAWMIGHRDSQGLPLLNHLASLGWTCFSIDYRLSPYATFPDHLVDVKRALAWIRAHGDEHGADTSCLVIAGNSAGGHLASLAALTANDPVYQPGFENADTSVSACISFYGVYDLCDRHGCYRHRGLLELIERHVMKSKLAEARERWDLASPIACVDENAPPFLVLHGDRDTLVPHAQAAHFVTAFRERARAPIAWAELPGAQHAFDVFPSLRTELCVRAVARFAAWVHAHNAARRTRAVSPGDRSDSATG